MSKSEGRRSFGYVRKLPSKRWHASYTGPDLARHNAPDTFEAKIDAEGWLAEERRAIAQGDWIAPKARRAAAAAMVLPTVAGYSADWLESRTLKPRTQDHYRRLLDRQILPKLGGMRLVDISPAVVRAWHTGLGTGTPTLKAHAYGLLRTIMASAVTEQLIDRNPCVLRGAGNSKTQHKARPASVAELEAIAAAMPDRLRLAALVAGWCGLRFGELAELRRSDVDVKAGVLHVRRAVTRISGRPPIVGKPKSEAGVRDVAIPPHLLPAVRRHLEAGYAAFGRDGLLFPAPGDPTAHLAPASLYKVFYPARKAAGRPDLRWHDLRHTGAVLAAGTGATLAELMGRLGHSTVGAAMRYQHAASERDAEIAAMLSRLAGPAK